MKNKITLILWQSSRLLLLAIFFIGWGLLSGCGSMPNETWYCYDEQGRPLEGVLIVCHYGLPNYSKHAVGYRFSDSRGMVFFESENGAPRGLGRGYDCIYSSRLQSGDAGIGERWHSGAPTPERAVYFDEYKNNIFIKSGVGDPIRWHQALNELILCYRGAKAGKMGGYPGVEKLEAALSTFVPKERAAFIMQYGDQLVPIEYIKSRRLNGSFPHLSEKENLGLKFNDITLALP